MQDGQVVGDFIAEVAQNSAILRLVDAGSPGAPVVQQALQAQGYKVLLLDQKTANPIAILQALGEDS